LTTADGYAGRSTAIEMLARSKTPAGGPSPGTRGTTPEAPWQVRRCGSTPRTSCRTRRRQTLG